MPVRSLAAERDTYQFSGLHNLLFPGVIRGAIFMSKPTLLREALMLAAAVGSMMTTKKSTHESNEFNFMVKSIADQQKVATPSFMGYVFRLTLPVRLPMLIAVWLLFFRC